jgi:hypothetical protein
MKTIHIATAWVEDGKLVVRGGFGLLELTFDEIGTRAISEACLGHPTAVTGTADHEYALAPIDKDDMAAVRSGKIVEVKPWPLWPPSRALRCLCAGGVFTVECPVHGRGVEDDLPK